MVPDRQKVWTDGRTEWTDGRTGWTHEQRQNYIPPTSSGENNDGVDQKAQMQILICIFVVSININRFSHYVAYKINCMPGNFCKIFRCQQILSKPTFLKNSFRNTIWVLKVQIKIRPDVCWTRSGSKLFRRFSAAKS